MSTPNDLLTFLRTRSMPKRLIRVGLALTSTIYSLRPDTLLAKSSRTSHEPQGGWLGEGGPAPLELPVAPARSRGELFFIDAGVADPGAFWLAAPKDATVVCIPAGVDSWAFMAQQAEKFHGLGAIHLVSHGEAGALILNDRRYTAADLDARAAQLQQLGRALTKNGDILLYGCSTGAGAKGQNFLDTLSALTGADIAASNDLTGNNHKGGNWELEIVTGSIEVAAPFSAQAMAGYEYVLHTASVSTIAQLKAAIAAGSTDGVADTITITGNLTFASAADAITINVTDGQTMTIVGGGFTLSGNNLARVLDITAGNVAINNLTITNGFLAGAGGNTPASGGGLAGEDALGAGIRNAGVLVISNSAITANKAAGGGGGGGGSGGGGGAGGGGGGFGSTFGGAGGTNPPGSPGSASAGSGGKGAGFTGGGGTMGGAGGTTSGGSGGVYAAYTSGGNGGTANNGSISIGGGGGGVGYTYGGGRGGNAAGGIHNTGTLTMVSTSVTNNIGAGGGGGGGVAPGSSYAGNGGAGGAGTGGIWNFGGTVLVDSSTNTSLATGNTGGAGAGGLANKLGSSNGAAGTATSQIWNTNGGTVDLAYVPPPAITSATYNAFTGVIIVTGTGMQALGGAANDIDASRLTLTGEGGSTHMLTDTADVEISSATEFTLTLSATDRAAVNQIVNKDGTASTSGTTYNLAAADDWNAAVTSGNSADLTGNAITASSVGVPAITSATYNASTGALAVTGTGFLKLSGATNDIDVSKLSLTGEGGSSYTLTTTSVEITSGTAFSVTLNATDRAAVNQLLNKDGTSSTGGTTYNLAAAEDWAAGADAAVVTADLTGNGVTASNVAVPAITSATYNAATGALVVTGTGFLSASGATNDIVANKFTLTGEGGGTYTLTDTNNVEIASGTAFTLTLSATDRSAINQNLNKDGTSSTGGTTYNLAAAEDWAAGADATVVTADLTGNAVTVSNVAVPAIASATYDASTGVLVVTGTGFLSLSGATNDIDVSKLTLSGDSTAYALTTGSVEITSGTSFSVALNGTDRSALLSRLNKDGISSTGGTTYNLAAAEDWAAGADAAVTTADLTANGITVSNTNAAPVISNLNGNAVTYIEGGSATLIDLGSDASVSDTDSADFDGGTLTVSIVSNKQSSEDVLAIGTAGLVSLSSGMTAGSTVTAGGQAFGTIAAGGTGTGTDDLIVTLNANATHARVASLLRVLTYANTNSTQPDTATRTVRVTVSDGDGGTSGNADVSVSVTGVNDAPTFSATGGTPTYTEGGSPVDLFSSVSISTVETGQTVTGFTLTVTNLANGSSEILRADGTDIALTNGTSGATASNAINYSVSVASTTATVTFTKGGGLSTANTQTVIDGLSYRNTSTAPGTASRAVTLTSIADNGGTANGGVDTTSLSVAATVAISAVNDAPVVTTSGGTTAFVEADGPSSTPVVIDSGLTLADVDSSTLVSATISITANYQAAQDLLAFTNDSSTMGNIAASTNTGGVLTLTSSGATATLAEWQSALRSVTYGNSSDTPDTGARTLSFVVNDGALASNAATKTVSVAATNDTPTFFSLSASTVNQSGGTNAVVGAFSTVDADHSAFTYTFVPGSGDNHNALFNISGANLRANDAAALAAGLVSVRIRTTDGGGLFFEKNFSLTIIDDVAPGAPSTPDLATVSDTGSSSADNITNVTTPTFTGTAEAGSTVELFRGGVTSLGTTTADGSGNWSLTLGTALPEGTYSITARATDSVPQTGAASSALSLTIDTTAAAAPVLTAITNDTGASATDQITSDNTLILSGTGAANETVTVFRNAAQIGTATANGSGAWSFDYTATTLAAGTHTFTATTTDLAGNVSPASAAFLVEIDTDTPSAPLIVAMSNDTGASTTDGITSDNTLLFAGTADANVTVTISRSGLGVIGTTTANVTGVWSFDYSGTALPDGAYLFTAFASDIAGNNSTVSADFPVTIDTTAPAITTQPVGGTYVSGNSFTLTVAATDATTLAHRWYLGATLLADYSNRTGSTTASVTHTGIGTVGFAGNYTVQLTDLAGNTTTSNAAAIIVNKADQTITFPVIADRLTTAAPFAVNASVNTGFTLAYSVVSGPATISGNTVTVTGAGIVTIRAAQAGDINYNPASVDRTFTVTKATAPVVLGGLAQSYTGSARTATATTTPSGLTVALTYDGGATAPVNAGSYAVVATINDATYQGTASGTLVVSAAAQSLTFTPVGSVTVNTPVTLTASAGSGLPVTFSLLSGNATLSGATLTANDANPITLRATQSGNANYNAITADQTVTNIAKIAQTIAFAMPADRPFAAPSFSLGATATSSLPVGYTVVSGPATLAGDVVTLTGIPGVVTITAQQAGNAIYAAAPDVTRSFSVLASYPAPTPDGFAGSVTGGAGTGSQSVTVTTAADFRTHAESTDLKVITVVGILNLGTPVAVRSNKTIQGADASATLVGNLLLPTGTSNVIIRGLNLTNPATSLSVISDANNAVTLAGARNVFITHCSFFDAAQHALKIAGGADNVTVSWSEFYNTTGALTVGSAVVIGNAGTETAPIRVSLHHNLWTTGVMRNLPAATYGHVHLYNNVFNTPGNATGTEALDHSQLLSERNVYTGVANPLTRRHVNTALPIGRILAIGNTYTGTTGTAPYADLDQVFIPSYSYEALPVSDVITVVTANAGNNAGANYTDDTTGSATLTGPGAPVTPGTAFALNAIASGFTPATYQWRRNNVAIAGATFATYNVASAGEVDAAVYTVAIVMGTGDMVVSRPLTIALNAIPVTPVDMQLQVDGGGAPSAWFLGALALLCGLRALMRRRSMDRS